MGMSFLDVREHGSKPGSGFISISQENVNRRERLRRLALETIDLEKDPYFMRNHLGKFECRLCLTLHSNEGSYLAHTQGKRHQTHLAKRAARERVEKPAQNNEKHAMFQKSSPIGRPGYRVTKQFDKEKNQRSLLFQVYYPEIEIEMKPYFRLMSTFEQHREPTDRRYQYVLFGADGYEVVAFKVPCQELNISYQANKDHLVQNLTKKIGTQENSFVYWEQNKKIYS